MERWKHLEYSRFWTLNNTPPLGYFLLHYLAKNNAIRTIITTNYDLFLNSIFSRFDCAQKTYFNPAINEHEFNWEEYYSTKKITDKNTLKIFKIHGSLTHVVFRKCYDNQNHSHIFKLPSFLIGFDTSQLRKMFNLKYLHNYLGHEGVKYNEPSLINDNAATGYYVHYIDWALKDVEKKKKYWVIRLTPVYTLSCVL